MKYRVVEKFISVNGEGRLAGQLAVFIRFAGCNLQCSYCDTSWANAGNVGWELMSGDEINAYIKETGIRNVTLTGGEPLLQEDIHPLLCLLAKKMELRVELETNGSVNLEDFTGIAPRRPIFTMDYKLGTSGMEHAMEVKNFQYLSSEDTVKFVVGSLEDLERAKVLIEKFALPEKCAVHLSPVFGKISMEDIVVFIKDNKMDKVRLQPQLHKMIWHPEARGV